MTLGIWKRIKKVFRWIGERLKDVLYGTDNLHLDLTRVVVFAAIYIEISATYHNIILKQPVDLGPNGLGGGLAAIITAGAGFLAAKAWSAKKAREEAAIQQNVNIAKQNETVVDMPSTSVTGNATPQEEVKK